MARRKSIFSALDKEGDGILDMTQVAGRLSDLGMADETVAQVVTKLGKGKGIFPRVINRGALHDALDAVQHGAAAEGQDPGFSLGGRSLSLSAVDRGIALLTKKPADTALAAGTAPAAAAVRTESSLKPEFLRVPSLEEQQEMEQIFQDRRRALPYVAPADYRPQFPPHTVGTYSNHGIQPSRQCGEVVKACQDRAGVEYPFLTQNLAAFLVFDGHGPAGECCADFALNKCLDELEATITDAGGVGPDLSLEQLELLLQPIFGKVHSALVAEQEFDSFRSGTTATVVLLGCSEPSWVAVANLGDSPCICGQKVDDDTWKAVDLTVDHKPDSPYELARIATAGGTVRKIGKNEHGHVWLPDMSAGLAMSRCIGDSDFHMFGVITQPHVACLELTPADRFLVICSDGLSEFLTSEEIVFLASQYENATDACTELVHEAMKRWRDIEGAYRDDITCTVVMMPPALEYMKGSGAVPVAVHSNGKVITEVAPSEAASLRVTRRERFNRRRSVICAPVENMGARDQTTPGIREPMPPAVLKKRRKSCTLSPDMDSELNQVHVEPPAAGNQWDDDPKGINSFVK